MRHCCIVLLLLAVSTSSAFAQKDKGKAVVPDRDWAEVIEDNKLAKAAPKDGIVVEAKAFEKLWKAWRKDEKVPEIDFTKKLVVVTLSLGGPNKPRCSARLTDEGDLKILALSTLIGGDGFGYSIGVYSREGVKKVNGKAVPAK